MSHPETIGSMRFEVDGAEYVTSGVDFREGRRLYESAVVGWIHLIVDGEELHVGDRLPNEFDISDTVAAMVEMICEFTTTGIASVTPFCCICGDRGCGFIRWKLDADDQWVALTMVDLLGEPLGAHRYRLRLETLCSAVAELSGRVETAMEAAGAFRTTAGTREEFVEWRCRLGTRAEG